MALDPDRCNEAAVRLLDSLQDSPFRFAQEFGKNLHRGLAGLKRQEAILNFHGDSLGLVPE
jgi:hypothetical protein